MQLLGLHEPLLGVDDVSVVKVLGVVCLGRDRGDELVRFYVVLILLQHDDTGMDDGQHDDTGMDDGQQLSL